jgi:hypothetical protein
MAAVALDGGRDLLSNGAIPHRLAVTRSRSRLPWSPDPTRIITPLHGIAAAMLSLSFSCSSLRFYFFYFPTHLCCAHPWSWLPVHPWLWCSLSVPVLCLPSHFPPLEMLFPPLIFVTNRLSRLCYPTSMYCIFGSGVRGTNPERLCGLPAMYFLRRRGKVCSCSVDA